MEVAAAQGAARQGRMSDDWDMPKTGSIEVPEELLASSAPKPTRTPFVTALSGARSGQALPVVGELTFGRHPECNVVLPENGVSRRHTRIELRGTEWFAIDLESTNGTFVNGQRIYDPQRLAAGDRIRVGATSVFRFDLLDELEAEFQRKQYESATHDALTGCFTKRYFLEHMNTDLAFALRHQEVVCLAMIDVDHFKKLNDTWGHPAGDLVLSQLGRLLIAQLRQEDVVARFGGEEFAVTMRQTPPVIGKAVAERIRAAVEQTTFQWAGVRLPVTVSVGIAAGPVATVRTPEQLIELADRMLYRAKESGRNRVVCAAGPEPPPR